VFVKQIALLIWRLDIALSSIHAISTKPSRASHEEGALLLKRKAFCCVPMVGQGVELQETWRCYVDCSAWIRTVLGLVNTNLTGVYFLSKLFSVEVKSFEETRGKFPASNQTESFLI